MNKTYKKILKAIKSYSTIVILRHEMPDFDASGSQFGLKEWILYNFPTKKVYALGENHKIFAPSLYPYNDENIILDEPYLCIIVDVANQPRVDKKEYIEKASYVIKIDHHPECDSFGHIQYVNTNACAASEIVADILLSAKRYKMPQSAAYYLYSGIVGDSGRFQYSTTNQNTFTIASKLLSTGINFTDIYNKMYLKSIEDIKVVKFLYNQFKITEKGVAYYHVYDKDLKELQIVREQIKAYVNLLSGYNEIKIWVQFTEDIEAEEYKWRVSIRSREVKINDVASQYHGGGHNNASGAKCVSFEETMQLVEDLNQLIEK